MRSFAHSGSPAVSTEFASQAQLLTGRDRPLAATHFARIQILERLLSLRCSRMYGGITF